MGGTSAARPWTLTGCRTVRFDEQVARTYDEDAREMFEPAALGPKTVPTCSRSSPTRGRFFEFAVGTGRVALPLARRGIAVSGLDISEPMLARPRAKPGAATISLTSGDFTSSLVDGPFALVYLVFNTIMNVTSQEEQVATFRNAAAHLAHGGALRRRGRCPGVAA